MHVAVFARTYPNNVLPRFGLWVQRQTAALARHCRMTVVAPSLYSPPLPLPEDYARFRRVERSRFDGPVEVHHPRFLVGPGYSTYALEAISQYLATRPLMRRLHRSRPFDVIHAHFTYPDGVASILLGRELRVPVVITEHNLWKPWMDDYPLVRRQSLWSLGRAAKVVTVSDAVRRTIEAVAKRPVPAVTMPVGVDGSEFGLRSEPLRPADEAKLLYVGWINYIKGVDVLLQAMPLLLRRHPRIRLTLIGGGIYRDTRRQENSLRRLAADLGLGERIHFAGPRSPAEVSQAMRDADALVLPSRRESCGAVLLEALACGTPVVATRCGGPEDIVTDAVGELAPPENPAALAEAMARVLARRGEFDAARLRGYALSRYSWDRLAEQYFALYRAACSGSRG
jgi:glycosyltransferase involved in cell wall biosynthesis